jgi:hypothetical protein
VIVDALSPARTSPQTYVADSDASYSAVALVSSPSSPAQSTPFNASVLNESLPPLVSSAVLSECAAARDRMHCATAATTTQAASCSATMNYQHPDDTVPLVYGQLSSLEGTPAVYALFHSEAEYLYQAYASASHTLLDRYETTGSTALRSPVRQPPTTPQRYEKAQRVARERLTLANVLRHDPDGDNAHASGLLGDDMASVRTRMRVEADALLHNPHCTGGECQVVDGVSGEVRPMLPIERSAHAIISAVGYDRGMRPWKRVHTAQHDARSPTINGGVYLMPHSLPTRCITAELPVSVVYDTMLPNYTTRAVVDSGAAWTSIRRDLFERLIFGHSPTQFVTATSLQFHGVTGDRLQVDGKVRIRITIAALQVETDAYVFADMAVPMLLGTHTLVEHGLTLDTASGNLYKSRGLWWTPCPTPLYPSVIRTHHLWTWTLPVQPAQFCSTNHSVRCTSHRLRVLLR